MSSLFGINNVLIRIVADIVRVALTTLVVFLSDALEVADILIAWSGRPICEKLTYVDSLRLLVRQFQL